MKKRTLAILIAVIVTILGGGIAYAAVTGIFNLKAVEGVEISPQKADKSEAEAVEIGEMIVYSDAERLDLTYSTDIESGKEYLVTVIRGEEKELGDDNIVYIDQLTATGNQIAFNLYPSKLSGGVNYHVYLSSDAENYEGMQELAVFSYGDAGVTDKSELNELISSIDDLLESDYTTDSWAVLQEALSSAKVVLENENATQDEIDAATEVLQEAIDALEPVNAELFEISDTEITITARSSYTLTVTGAENVTWSSSDESVATVVDGVVTAVRYGTADIYVSNGSETLSCEVHVLFSDVTKNSQYFYNPVYWAAENGITVGYADGSFGVGLDCQRRELMIFLWRYAGCPGKGDTVSVYGDARNMFNDLKSYGPTSATNQAIAWAYSEGITKGYSDGGFHPKDSIVRKDVMILLYRLADKPDVSGVLKYPDCKQYKTSSDTYRAILWGSQNGITKGYSSGQYAGQFGAKLNCLREQIVTFLYRFNNL